MRVIAGEARGRTLKAPASGRVRPTGDKVKSAIFSALEALAYKLGYGLDADADDERFAAAQAWPRVLVLYSGSGALWIEALSRGAEWADFVEGDAAARKALVENLRATGLADRAAIHPLGAERVLSTLTGNYDLILADPPYADGGAEQILAAIAASPLASGRSVLAWEHARDRRPPEQLGKLRLRRTRQYGAAAISLYAGELATPERAAGGDAEHSSA
jgi:16S rRNA (guanine966-N2)-methyltransferase